jgi:hypothetical protein
MKIIRRWLARVLFTVGVLSLGLWAGARFLVHTVEDGTVLTTIARTALHTPALQDLIVNRARSEIDDALDDEGIDPVDYGLDDDLDQAIVEAVGSDGFIDSLLETLAEIEANMTAQLTDDSLPLAPLEFTIDVTEPLHEAISEDTRLAFLVPDTALDPFSVRLLDEEEVESIRGGYDWIELAAAWGLWFGLGLLVLGFVLLPKKRWIPPKLFLWVGLFVLGLWALARWIDVESVYKWLPGGSEGDAASFMRDLAPQETVDRAEGSLLMFAVGLLVVSGALFVLIWWLSRERKGKGKEPAPASTGATPAAPPTAAPTVPPAATAVVAPPAPTAGTPAPATRTPMPRKGRKAPPRAKPPAPTPATQTVPPPEAAPTTPKAPPPEATSPVPTTPPSGAPPTAPPTGAPPAEPAESPAPAPKVWNVSDVPPPPEADVGSADVPPTEVPSGDTPLPDSPSVGPAVNPLDFVVALKESPLTETPETPTAGSEETAQAPEEASSSVPASASGSEPAPGAGVPPAAPAPEPPAPPKVKLGRAAARRAREFGESSAAASRPREGIEPTEPPAKPAEPPAKPAEPPAKPKTPEDPVM